MAGPRFLMENFFDPVFFGPHVVSASSELSTNLAFRVGGGRRSSQNFWAPTVSGLAWVQVACNRPRFADMLVLDRNHNLTGFRVRVQASNDGFATNVEVASAVVSPAVGFGSQLNAGGVRTEEGAFLISFPGRVATSWRFVIDDMGGGLKPKVGGLYLGKSWAPREKPKLPWDDDARELRFREVLSDSAWAGTSRKASRRRVAGWVIDLEREEYGEARYHFHSIYWRGGFCWAVPDEAQAERALMLYAEPGTYSMAAPTDWPGRRLVFSGVEVQPLQGIQL